MDTSKILKILKSEFPNARSELNYESPYQLTIAVMLSAQCTDKKVNEVTPYLFDQYPNFQALAKAKLERIANIIRPINYFQTKSRHLIAAAQMVENSFSGTLPLLHEELIKLPGVGRKTANVVLSELGISHTLPVDTHVYRVAKRLGLAHSNSRDKVELELQSKFKSKDWRSLHHGLILHGRKTCKARKPLCNACRLSTLCPSNNQ